MNAVYQSRLIAGVPSEMKPVRNAPLGAHRLRFRQDSFGQLFVRTSTGIRRFALEDHGDYWQPGFEIGRNEGYLIPEDRT